METTVEEPVEPVAVEEVAAEQPEATVDESATSAAAASQAPDLLSLLSKEFSGETDDPLLDEVAKTITPDFLKSADPSIRAMARALVRAEDQRKAAADKAATERETAFKAREDKIAAERKAVVQQRQALLEMAAKVQKPTEPTNALDPLNPDSVKAHIEHAAQAATYNSWQSVIQEREQVARQNAWDAIVDRHPSLSDEKIAGEFDDFFVNTLNKGRDLPKQGSVVTAEIAADLFFSNREREQLAKRQSDQSRTRDAERAAAARAVGRSSGGARTDQLANMRDLIKQGRLNDAMTLASSNPQLRAAFIEETRAL